MAKKFFNQNIKKKKNISITKIGIIAILAIVVVIIIGLVISAIIYNNSDDVAKVELRDSVAVEINSELPDKTLFFTKLENIDEDDILINYDNVNLNTLGEYEVIITINEKEYTSNLEVVDTESPTLVVQDVKINSKNTYTVQDFISSCTDNSNEECIISFYTLSVDENGEKIDYSSYTKEGTYTIQIIASDASGNTTGPYSATLTIGASTTSTTTTSCTYGTTEYDETKYTLAIDITSNGCAIDLNKYQDEDMLAGVNSILESEKTKLKNQFNKIKLDTTQIYLDSTTTAILNTTGTGVVGYQLYIEVYTYDENYAKSIHTAYYMKSDGTRKYVYNKYNLN